MSAPLDVAVTLALASRDITEPSDADQTLRTILDVARESMPEIDQVGITLAHRDGGIETRVATDPVVLELDRLQSQLREGPCLHAIEAGPMVRVEHAKTDERWPRFMPAAVELGMRSQLGIRLHIDARTMGVLTMYSFSSETLSEETEQMAELFAAHVSLVLGYASRLENLSAALTSRKMIGIALGLVMQRHDLDEQTAFAYLTRLSATSERKLRDVAATLVEEHQVQAGARLVEPSQSR